MTVDAAGFRTALPEFAAAADATVNFWLAQAPNNLNAALLGTQYDLATILFVAHYVSMRMADQRAAAAGGIPGQTFGPVTSKTAGPVSKTMGAGLSIDARAGQYNNTSYGQQLWTLISGSASGPRYSSGLRGRIVGEPANPLEACPGFGRRW